MAIDTEIMNSVRELTNEELFQRLQGLGFDIGPVIRTTRSVYEKKLYKALTGQLPSPLKEVIGDQLCIRGDDNDVGDEEEDDDDSDESSFYRRNAKKGAGDFNGSSILVVEDSLEEDNSFLNERFEPSFESSLNVSSIQPRMTDNDFTNGDLDGDDDIPNQKWVALKKGRLYPELEKPPEVSEERVEYYLKKYGPDESENSFDDYDLNHSMDTSELRRRPLHSVREVKKTYPASFIKVDVKRKIKEPEKVPPPFLDTPTFEHARAYNHIPKASNGISYNPPKSNGVVAKEIVEDKRPPFDLWGAITSPVGIVAVILLVFIILVFLSIEPQQELPKLLVPADKE